MKQVFWIKAADKDFRNFPQLARDRILEALDAAALGGKSDISKPMQGLGSGIFEVALHIGQTLFGVFTQFKLEMRYGLFMPFRKNRQLAFQHQNMKLISSNCA